MSKVKSILSTDYCISCAALPSTMSEAKYTNGKVKVNHNYGFSALAPIPDCALLIIPLACIFGTEGRNLCLQQDLQLQSPLRRVCRLLALDSLSQRSQP